MTEVVNEGRVFNISNVEPKVEEVLIQAWMLRQRLRIWYGDPETGRPRMDEHEVVGYVGRSMGPVKVPLLVHNARSRGGAPIAAHCIVRIDWIAERRTMYQHPKWYFPGAFIERSRTIDGHWELHIHHEGRPFSLHPTPDDARRLLDFLKGDRYIK